MKKILMAMVVFALLFTAIVSARAGTYTYTACQGNLIKNWDFTGGKADFDSDYIYVNPLNKGPWTVGPEQRYTVSTNPNDYHSAWKSFGDHTTGTGNMMIVNAACVAGSSYCIGEEALNKRIWSQTVAVQPNTNYTFSYWVALSYSDTGEYSTQPPKLRTLINGEELGTYDAQAIVDAFPPESSNGSAGNWVQVKYDWFSGTADSAEIVIIDKHAWQYGDDFALDDIELCAQTPCARTNLIAGKYEDVGDVSIYFDNGNLYVTYTVEAPWCFTELHLDLRSDFKEIPQKNGNPIPGKFRYKYYPAGGACETTYTFPPITATCPVYIAAHAAVMDTTGYACTVSSTVLPTVTTCYRTETAWGQGSSFLGKNWAMYFNANACFPACPSQ